MMWSIEQMIEKMVLGCKQRMTFDLMYQESQTDLLPMCLKYRVARQASQCGNLSTHSLLTQVDPSLHSCWLSTTLGDESDLLVSTTFVAD
jgi:hypothetical protein